MEILIHANGIPFVEWNGKSLEFRPSHSAEDKKKLSFETIP
jgi:hypothetical protein